MKYLNKIQYIYIEILLRKKKTSAMLNVPLIRASYCIIIL